MKMPLLRFKKDDGSEYPDWEEKELKDACDIIGGGTPKTSIKEYWNGNIKWFTPTEITTKYVSDSIRTITDLGLMKSSAKLLPAGTVLLTTRATLGKMAIATKECSTNQGFHSLVTKDCCINEFVYYLQPIIEEYCMSHHTVTTFKETSKSALEKCAIPVPCLEEQQKIADFLSDVDVQIVNYQETLANLEAQKSGLLHQVFSQKLRFTKEDGSKYPDWEEDCINSIGTCIAGATPSTKNKAFWENGTISWLSSGEVNKRQIFYTDKKITQLGYDSSSTKMVKANSVVIAMAGQGKTRGTVGITRIPLCTNQSICSIETNDRVLSDYLYQYLKTRYMDLRNVSSGDDTRGGLNLEIIRNFDIIYPSSLEEQQKIADFFSDFDKRIELERQRLQAMQELKKGLLQQMFC